MKTVCEKNKCNGCMACIEKCPKQCIKIEDSLETFNAVIDESKCINCNLCKKICPNVNKVKKFNPLLWYQGWAKDSIRKQGSSGGIASSIICNFIKNGGYVASCIYEDKEFRFEVTNDIQKAKKFAGSKYVKSNPNGIYSKIEKILKDNKVLFIGLPCQVAGLLNTIKNKQNLYTIDLICHGTPSQKLLIKFLNEEGINEKNIWNIQFRKKMDFGIIINESKIRNDKVLDEYTCAFLESVNYTENCYSCDYAKKERISDITLGDSWGSDLKDEEENGISLVIVQSEKGKELIDKSELVLKNVNIENAIKHNHQLERPSILTDKRKKYFELIKKGKSIKYATFYVLTKMVMRQKIKNVLKKLKIMR